MTRVVFLDPAEEEMLEAAAYYEDRANGLGDHFIAEVQHAVQRIMESPESSRVIKGKDLENSAKTSAWKLPVWFIFTLYPILLTLLVLLI